MTEYAQSSSWSTFLKSVASFSGDLSTLSAPPFILSPISLSEFPQYWGANQDLFLEIGKINKSNFKEYYSTIATLQNAETARMLTVLKWFISTLRCQYSSRKEKNGFEKKPLNPFLGELFVAKWENKDSKIGSTTLLTEQVSHHPPINAFTIFNDNVDIKLEGYTHIKSSFSKTLRLNVKQHGHNIIETSAESFLITYPTIHLEGILMASPYVELESKSYIQATSGLIWEIEYSGKGYFSGRKNTFKARLFRNSNELQQSKSPLFTVSGQWSGKSEIEGPQIKTQAFFDVNQSKIYPLTVKAIAEQHELESRKAWGDVARAIELGDMKLISQTKTKLENAQRELRKDELKKGNKWKRRWFKDVNFDEADVIEDLSGDINSKFLALSRLARLSIKNVQSTTIEGSRHDDPNTTAIHWVFDKNAWDQEKEIKL